MCASERAGRSAKAVAVKRCCCAASVCRRSAFAALSRVKERGKRKAAREAVLAEAFSVSEMVRERVQDPVTIRLSSATEISSPSRFLLARLFSQILGHRDFRHVFGCHFMTPADFLLKVSSLQLLRFSQPGFISLAFLQHFLLSQPE